MCITDMTEGCKVLVGLRTGRRHHSRTIAKARVSRRNDSEHAIEITLEIRRYHRKQLQPLIIRVPDQQLRDIEEIPTLPGLYRLTSVLYLGDDQSEDTFGRTRPPVIFSEQDLIGVGGETPNAILNRVHRIF
jgi:hypothetical protein